MTDKSDGPYIHEHEHSCEYECLACAYAKGRKAAEKELEEKIDAEMEIFDRFNQSS